MVPRIVSIFLLWTICSTAMGFSVRTERWNEDALLHDGRIIKVERNVEWTFRVSSGDAGSGFALFKNWPDRFWLKFTHPETQKTIEWQGAQFFEPVLLDLVDGVPYLVVLGKPDKKTEKIYGCPELPYIFLKYGKGVWDKWVPVPVEAFPDSLKDANLSPDFYHTQGGAKLSRNDVLSNIQAVEGSSKGYFQSKIPRGYDDWFYTGKNSHRNERMRDDCRPPRSPPPQVALPSASEGSPEILETIDYTPDRIVIGDDWSNLVFDKKREGACKGLFRPTDPNDYMQGQRFVNDSTGAKPAPYSRSAQFNMGVRVLCDEHVWFVTHQEEPGKIVISKFTVTGDLVYRTSFRNPGRVEGFVSYIRIPSLRSEGGYLSFDWLDFRDINREWHIKRWWKLRILEPKANIAGADDRSGVSGGNTKMPALSVSSPIATTKGFRDCEVCPEMIEIPGTDYALGKYEVTQAEWTALMGENVQDDRSGPTVGADKPALRKNWDSAQAYIARLNRISGKNYRLPSEAEWEYACYAGSQTKYCGSNDMDAVAWFEKDGRYAPHAVGQKQPNGYGLYDMSGNVWEWMNDCWKGNCAFRVLRGGSFNRHPLTVREAYIYGKTDGYPDVGFRVLRSSADQPQNSGAIKSDAVRLYSGLLPLLAVQPPRELASGAEMIVVSGYHGNGSPNKVNIDRPGSKVLLVLTSYAKIDWQVSASPTTIISGIIVSGYEQPTVTATNAKAAYLVKLPYTYETENVKFKELVTGLSSLFGVKKLDVFRGSYSIPQMITISALDPPRIEFTASDPLPKKMD